MNGVLFKGYKDRYYEKIHQYSLWLTDLRKKIMIISIDAENVFEYSLTSTVFPLLTMEDYPISDQSFHWESYKIWTKYFWKSIWGHQRVPKAVKICKLLIPQKDTQKHLPQFSLLGIFLFEKNAKILSNQTELLAERLSKIFCSFRAQKSNVDEKRSSGQAKNKVSDNHSKLSVWLQRDIPYK